MWNLRKRRITCQRGIDDEEIEEPSFIPSAVREPRWALHMCDNDCNKEGFKFHQLAAIVVKGGGTAAHTINLCKKYYHEMRMKRCEREMTASGWRVMIEQKAFRGQLWSHLCEEYRGHFTITKSVGQISLGSFSGNAI